MYLPEVFRITDQDVLLEFVHTHSFGQLVTVRESRPHISQLPFVLTDGVLQGHLALANPQATHLEDDTQAWAIFNGAHAFISSSCYAPPSGIATWNYMTVHIEGRLRRIKDETGLWSQLDTLTRIYESSEHVEELLSVAHAKGALLQKIVGFELRIERMEGKFKLSQNRSPEDRERIICDLQQRNDTNAQQIAAAMLNLSPTQ